MPGGSGHVGQSLQNHFRAKGDEVIVISRHGQVSWDGKTLGPWAETFEGADVIINLAGRTVNCRYSQANLDEMMSSRVDSTRVVGQAISQCKNPPKVWLQSSTATIYAHRFDAPNDDHTGILGSKEDNMPPKWLASVEIAKAWERTLDEAQTPHTRKVALRSAMVMAPIPGSVFAVFVSLAKKGLLGQQASGRQFVSWIHESDFCRAIDWIIEHEEITGPINLASPNPLPQKDFSRILRQTAKAPFGLPTFAWMLEIGTLLMQTETELVLKSRRVTPSRLLQEGFVFDFPEWENASRDLVSKL